MMSKTDLTPEELETVKVSRLPTTVITANGSTDKSTAPPNPLVVSSGSGLKRANENVLQMLIRSNPGHVPVFQP